MAHTNRPMRPGLGDRVTRDGGTWATARDHDHSDRLLHDWRALKAETTPAEFAQIWADVKHLMGEAAAGRLTWVRPRRGGPSLRVGEVEHMVTTTDILELRVESLYGDAPDQRMVRLYFTEPPDNATEILALSLTGKPSGLEGVEIQNHHVREAEHRLHVHRITTRGPLA